MELENPRAGCEIRTMGGADLEVILKKNMWHLKNPLDNLARSMQVSGSWKVKCFHIRELRDEVRALLACFPKREIHWQSRGGKY